MKPINIAKERGAVLIFGLIILAGITILGSSSANMGVVNQKIVLNAQNSAEVFQAAETAGAYGKSQSSWVNDALAHIDDPNYNSWNEYEVPVGYNHVDVNVTLSARKALLQGFTLNADSSVSYVKLEAEGDASRGPEATKQITQGWIRVGAG